MGTRTLKILIVPALWLLASGAWVARAAGTGDPTFPQILTRARPVGVMVDWRVRLRSVRKTFYTYRLAARVVPDPGQHCDRCDLTVVFRGRPQDLARPPVFRDGEIVAVRGVVLTTRPTLTVLASSVVVLEEP